jgi:hypothetical protein
MATTFSQNIPRGMKNDFSSLIAIDTVTVKLSAGAEQNYTVPSDTSIGGSIGNMPWYLAVFTSQAGKTVSVSDKNTAVVPPTSIAKTGCILVSGERVGKLVKPGATLSVITSDTTAEFGIEIFATNT